MEWVSLITLRASSQNEYEMSRAGLWFGPHMAFHTQRKNREGFKIKVKELLFVL